MIFINNCKIRPEHFQRFVFFFGKFFYILLFRLEQVNEWRLWFVFGFFLFFIFYIKLKVVFGLMGPRNRRNCLTKLNAWLAIKFWFYFCYQTKIYVRSYTYILNSMKKGISVILQLQGVIYWLLANFFSPKAIKIYYNFRS